MGISPKGSGKTPAGKIFLGELMKLEREEKEAFDEEAESSKEKKKTQKIIERALNKKADNVEIDEEEGVAEMGDKDQTPKKRKVSPNTVGPADLRGIQSNKKRKLNPFDISGDEEITKKGRRSKNDALHKINELAFDNNLEEETEKQKKKSFKDCGETSAEVFNFHPKQRVADCITPEALFLSLYHGSGNLLLKSDEYKVR